MSGAGRGRELTVREFPILIGRSDECQLRFDPAEDTKVSALHAEIRLEADGTFYVSDLESRNGTFLNGGRVVEREVLPERSILELGQGGPRVDVIVREGGSGVSFLDIRRKTGHFGGGGADDDRPMVATDDAMPVYEEAEPAPRARISERIKPKPQVAMFIVVALVAAILVGALIYFT
jgi:predicted component of type VI protein secretion system